jgi:hypothetical protein
MAYGACDTCGCSHHECECPQEEEAGEVTLGDLARRLGIRPGRRRAVLAVGPLKLLEELRGVGGITMAEAKRLRHREKG